MILKHLEIAAFAYWIIGFGAFVASVLNEGSTEAPFTVVVLSLLGILLHLLVSFDIANDSSFENKNPKIALSVGLFSLIVMLVSVTVIQRQPLDIVAKLATTVFFLSLFYLTSVAARRLSTSNSSSGLVLFFAILFWGICVLIPSFRRMLETRRS